VPGAAELRTLRRRIRSVRSTQQITRSFELIAASRITRARNQVEAARPYASMVVRVIADLTTQTQLSSHPLLTQRPEPRRVGVLVIASDRGLAGAYNTNVLRRAERLIGEETGAGREVDLYSIGRRAEVYFRFRGLAPSHQWTGMSDRPRYADAEEVARNVTDAYVAGTVDRLWMVYTDFRSALVQVSSTAKLLPVDPAQFAGGQAYPPEFEFEPDPDSILEQLIPRYVEQQVYAGLLESAASEHASRQRAMKSATDNAGDLIEDLTREANRARQASITTEISEIVGGAEALSGQS
jgi:F-type H+-transporting ATPase subunit gamma